MSKDKKPPECETGCRKPPASTRFQKGQSGNPKGRPRGRRNELPYEAVLGQRVTIREDGQVRQVTAAEAFVLHMTKLGLEDDSAAARDAMAAIENARAARDGHEQGRVAYIMQLASEPGSVNDGLTALRMAKKLDRHRPSGHMAIEPWLAEKALERLGDRRLTRDEQVKVVRATRTPKKVRWPECWEVRP